MCPPFLCNYSAIFPCKHCSQGLACKSSIGNLHNLYGFGFDKLSVEKFVCRIANAVYIGELFGESSYADRTSAYNPVITEITESNRFAAGFRIGHKLGNAYPVPQNGIISMIPDRLPGIILK